MDTEGRNRSWIILYNASNAERIIPRKIRYVALAYNATRQDAEDAWQYALMKSLDVVERFQGKPDDFRGWLFGTAKNHLVGKSRKAETNVGYWKLGDRVEPVRPRDSKWKRAKWVRVYQPVQVYTDLELEYVPAQRVETGSIVKPRRSAYWVSLKEEAQRPPPGMKRILFDYLIGVGKPVKTCRVRPVLQYLFQKNGYSSDFKWASFHSILDCKD